MLEMHHSGWEPSICNMQINVFRCFECASHKEICVVRISFQTLTIYHICFLNVRQPIPRVNILCSSCNQFCLFAFYDRTFSKMGIFDTCQKRVESKIEKVFQKYGELVGKHPLPFIILPILIFGGLGAGLLRMDEETDMEKVYFPQNSPAIEDRQVVRDIFPDVSNQFYNVFSLSDPDRAVTLLFRSKENIFSNSSVSEIAGIISGVKNLKGSGKMFGDFCAKMSSRCVVEGEFALTPSFRFAVANGNVTYPVWNGMDLASTISGTELSGQTLMSATVLRVSFKLAEEAKDWTHEFLAYAETLDPENIEVAYETPASLSKELDKSTKGDIVFFSLTITLCCCYASVVTASCNCVSTRSTLAMGGILAAGLGIVGSMGLLSLCGVKYVSIVGVIPFLIIGRLNLFVYIFSWPQNANAFTTCVQKRKEYFVTVN